MAYPPNTGAMPGPKVHIPIMTDNRGVDQKTCYQSQQHSQGQGSRQPNGVPRARLLTVDEALQYSPLSSIVPFSSSEFFSRRQDALDHINDVVDFQASLVPQQPIVRALGQFFKHNWRRVERGSQWSFSTKICFDMTANLVLHKQH